MDDSMVISAKNFSEEQLAAIEERAGKRLLRMLPVMGHVGHLTLATASLLMEITEECHPESTARVYIVAKEDLQYIIRSYLKRHKLRHFPYKNGALLDYISYCDFERIAGVMG